MSQAHHQHSAHGHAGLGSRRRDLQPQWEGEPPEAGTLLAQNTQHNSEHVVSAQ